ncbi:unnamed protein product, partial [Rotaria socialis]
MSDRRRRRSSPSRFRLAQHRFLDDNNRYPGSTNSLHQQLLLQAEKIVRKIIE